MTDTVNEAQANDELPTYNVLHTVVNEEPLELERDGEVYVPDMPQAKLGINLSGDALEAWHGLGEDERQGLLAELCEPFAERLVEFDEALVAQV